MAEDRVVWPWLCHAAGCHFEQVKGWLGVVDQVQQAGQMRKGEKKIGS